MNECYGRPSSINEYCGKLPKDVHILIPRTCEYVLYMIKGILQIWLNASFQDRELIRPKVITRVLIRRQQEDQREKAAQWQKQGLKSEREIWRCHTVGFEDGGRDHEARNVGSARNCKRWWNRFSPRASRQNADLLTPRFRDLWSPVL